MKSSYINRELSWIEFNQRVLSEAQRPDLPILDRLKFLAITGSNLDEFFQVRLGGLHTLNTTAPDHTAPSGHTVTQLLSAIDKRLRRFCKDQSKLFQKELLPQLAEAGLPHHNQETLSAEQATHLENHFHNQISPLLSPLYLTPENAHKIIPSLTVSLALKIHDPSAKKETDADRIVILPIPTTIPRTVLVNQGGFILIEELISQHSHTLFPGETITEKTIIRLTRNTDIPANEDEAHDFAAEIHEVITARGQSFPVRLQTSEDNTLTQTIISLLKLPEQKIYHTKDTPLALTDLFALSLSDGYDHLRTPSISGAEHPQIDPSKSIFDTLDTHQNITLVHPYQSYRPVVRFLQEAAEDPHVLAIKQTLYRTAKDSQIVDALIKAAHNGKQVTALVELKARFDEAHNLDRAEELRRAGAQVLYGVKGLKTHAKISLVIRNQDGQLKRYLHLGTGNYNEVTARFYTDISYLTCQPQYGTDASTFFNAVTGRTKLENFRTLVPAPTQIKRTLLSLIEEETQRALEGQKARISAKMNALEDLDMIDALYAASRAGVKIRLNIRGICCLKLGERKEAKNIEIISIIDQQLEHMRIFHFHHGGEEKLYISSADWMTRNLEKRIELMTPITDSPSKKQLLNILDASFRDNQNAYQIQPDGSSKKIQKPKGQRKFRMQSHLTQHYARKAAAAQQARSSSLEPHLPK